MALPDVSITLSNGNLGRLPASQDGVAGLIVGPSAVAPSSGALMTPYLVRSLAEAEALGINQAYDVANEVLAWHHIKEFFLEANGPTSLWVIISNQVPTAYYDVAGEADKLMAASSGTIRILASCYTPPGGVAGTATEGLPNGVITQITEAKAFVARQFTAHKPVRVMIEGYGIDSVVDLTYDLRDIAGPNADAVMVVIGQSAGLLPDTLPDNGIYASVCRVLGRAARIPVHYNVGRVKDGALIGVLTANFSDGTSIAAATDAQLNTLNTLGYVFFRVITGKDGVFINDDHMASPLTSDYRRLLDGRVIDKAARIAYRVYVEELNGDVELNETTGFMALSAVKNLEGIVESAISTEMAGEITGVDAYINPEQNISASEELLVEINLTRRGIAGTIRVTLGYAIPAASNAA